MIDLFTGVKRSWMYHGSLLVQMYMYFVFECKAKKKKFVSGFKPIKIRVLVGRSEIFFFFLIFLRHNIFFRKFS